MPAVKQLIGKYIPPGPDIAPGVRARPILIIVVTAAVNKSVFIVNGEYILSFEEAKEILRGEEKK